MNEALLDEITIVDINGFELKQWFWWLPESREDEIYRLEMNIAKYKEFLKNNQKFTPAENKIRMDEFKRLNQLKT